MKDKDKAVFKGDVIDTSGKPIDENILRLRAIHLVMKQIASNTENSENADTDKLAKWAAAELREVIHGMDIHNTEQK